MATNKSFVFWEHLQAAITDLWTRFNTALAKKVNSSTYTAGMAGKSDKGHLHEISDVNDLQEQLQALASTQGATEEKEVVSVETYSDLDELEEKSEGVVYITTDDNKVYLYSETDDEFVEVTNEVVDNTIYVNNLNDLISRTYTSAGLYTVIHSYTKINTVGRIRIRVSKTDTYTLAVVASRVTSGRLTPMRYMPYLTSKNGWAEVVTNSNDDEVWQWHIYSYQAKEVTHSELLDMIDNNELVVGQQYRITDYVTTVNDPDGETRSAGHPFDLLVTAATTNKLATKAIPLHSSRDTAGYFNGYDLEKCEVWYDVQNDTDKYEWADATNGKGVIWRMRDFDGNDFPYDFKNVQYKRYAITDITSSSLSADALSNLKSIYCYDQNGGKCFATKDVWGNFIPQDSNGTSYEIDDETFDWYYTLHGLKSEDGETIEEGYDMSTHGLILTDECLQYLEDDGCGADTQDYCKDNHIKAAHYEYFVDDEYYKGRQVLNNIVFINGLSYCYYNEEDEYWEYSTGYCYGNVFGVECKNNTFGNNCYNNTFGNDCYYNTFGNDCYYNTFGNGCSSNTFGNYFQFNTFGNSCYRNTFGNYFQFNTFGNNCYNNTFGNNCYNNTFGNDCYYNTFGNNCYNNTFGNYCHHNTFGNGCSSNTFGNNCYNNTFGNDCYYNTFGNGCSSNTFGNYFQFNTFGNSCYRNTFGNYFQFNTFGNNCYNNTFGNNCYNNTFGNDCYYNTFGNNCYNNTFGNYCHHNTFGNNCYNNTFGNGCSSNTFGNYVRYLTVFDGVQYVAVTGGSSSNAYVQNAQILNGTQGSDSNNRLTITFTANASYTQVAGKNSSGTLKIWVPADLV